MLPAARISRPHLIAIASLSLLAFLLRAYQLRESLWIDELHTAWTIGDGLLQISPRAKIGNQSPLYFFMPWLTTSLFGANEMAIRLPSLVAGVLLVPLAFFLIWKWTQDTVSASLAGFLVAVDPNLIFYAQEARPYAWVQLLGAVHVLAMCRAFADPGYRWRLVFIGTGVLLFYFHYTAAFILAADFAIFVILAWRNRDTFMVRWQSFVTELAVIAVATIPAWSHLREIARRRTNWQVVVEQPSFAELFQLLPLGIYVLLPLVVVLVAWAARTPIAVRRTTLIAAAWYFVPVTFAWLLTNADVARLFSVRYLGVAVLAPIMLGAMLVSSLRSLGWRIALSLSVGLWSIYSAGYWQQWRHDGRLLADRNEPWRDVVALINADEAAKGFPVLLAPNLIEDAEFLNEGSERLASEWSAYFQFPLRGLYRLQPERSVVPISIDVTSFAISKQLHKQIQQSGGAWLIVRGNAESAQQVADHVASELMREPAAINHRSQNRLGNLLLEKFSR